MIFPIIWYRDQGCNQALEADDGNTQYRAVIHGAIPWPLRLPDAPLAENDQHENRCDPERQHKRCIARSKGSVFTIIDPSGCDYKNLQQNINLNCKPWQQHMVRCDFKP